MSDQPPHGAAYAPLADYAAPARGTAELWRIFAVLILLIFLWDMAQALIGQALLSALGPLFGAVMLANLNFGATPVGVVGQLILSLPKAAVFFLAVALVTGRGPASLLGNRARLGPDFLAGFLPVAGISLGALALVRNDPALTAMQAPGTVLTWAPLALVAILVTAATSTLIFIGFLQQQLAARFAPSWVWMGLPAALFALMQGAPPAAQSLAPVALLWSLAFAAANADLTARTGSLGAAIGLTSGLVAGGVLLLAQRGPMNGLALYVLEARGLDLAPWMGADFLTLLVGWLATRLVLRV